MINVLAFLLKANLIFTVLFAVYWLLREEKFLVGNRLILLAIVLTAIVIPLGPNLILSGMATNNTLVADIPRFNALLELNKEIVPKTSGWIESGKFLSIGMTLYGIVVILLLGRLIHQISQIFKVVKNSSREKQQGLVYCEPVDDLPPFSFFNYIVIRRAAFTPEQYKSIIAHELCHCRQLHSIDVLLSELACILFWVNPLIYVYRAQVKLNLEFIADDQVLRSGVDPRVYQLNLVGIAIKKPLSHLINTFYTSKIRKRISLMNTEPSQARKRFKYAGLLPFIAGLYMLTNCEQPQSTSKGQIFIDARTNIARFTLGPASSDVDTAFKGIYVVNGHIFTGQQIRELVQENGQLEFTFSSPPALGIYTPNDKEAIRKWGNDARNGVMFIEPGKKVSSSNL